MRHLAKLGALGAGLAGLAGAAGTALAQQPTDWEVDFQTALSPSMERIVDFNLMVTIIIVIITAFVFALMAWIVIRYNKKRNPVPSKTTHNTMLEVIWTVVPVIILLVIAVALVPAPLLHRSRRGRGHDAEGDRPPVVLVLRVSRPR